MVMLSAGTHDLNEVIAMLDEFGAIVHLCYIVSRGADFTGRDVLWNVLDGECSTGGVVVIGISDARHEFDYLRPA